MNLTRDKFFKLIKYFSVTLIVIIGVALFVMVYAEYMTIHTSREWMGIEEETIIKTEVSLLDNEVGMILSDLNYLKSQMLSVMTEASDLDFLNEQWHLFANSKSIYDHIRYIDETGKERIRINRKDDRVTVVTPDQLQYKGDRYYYKKTAILNDGAIYISPFDLNIEAGKVELPRKPMIRFATPIYASDGTYKGIVILNYLGENILTQFEEMLLNSSGNLYLVNRSGYYLYSGLPHRDFSFMFEDQEMNSFVADFPKAWEQIRMGYNSFNSEKGFFFVKELNIKEDIVSTVTDKEIVCDSRWYVVSHVPTASNQYYYLHPQLISVLKKIINENIIFFVFLILLALMIGVLFYQNKASFNRIRYLSEYDGMTGILNRRAGLNALRELLRTYDARTGKMFLCYLDVDGLKQVNDHLGHTAGDQLLMTVVAVVQEMIRESDLFIRLGGDEFLLVLHHMDKDVHKVIWKRIENEISRINLEESRPYVVSVSKGFLEVTQDNHSSLDVLMKKADALMYQDKLSRHDRSVIK